MKKKVMQTIVSLSLAAAMGVTSPAVLFAEEQTASTESAQTTAEDFTVTLESGDLTVTNQTTRTITKAEYKKAENTEEKTEEKAEEATEENDSWNLEITEENGDVHVFENVTADQWKEPLLYDQYGILYISYQDENAKEQEAAETTEEIVFEEPLTMYVSENVHIRKEASKESESLKVAQLGDEWKVTSVVPGWFKVENGDISGYAFHKYLTEDKEAVDALIQAKKDAEAKAAAEAEAAASYETESQTSTYVPEETAPVQTAPEQTAPEQTAPEETTSQEVYEVSREAYDDCDGSGHGYYEITYSDGSVEYEEY
jgi:hypothetical protein